MKIQHLGIVVSDLDETLSAFGLSRKDIQESVYDPNQKNELHFVHLKENDCWLELVEPKDEKASTYKFAQKFGMGLHHIGMDSDDLAASEAVYKNIPGAFVLGRYAIHVKSFGGNIRTLFVAVKGLILEFVKKDDC